MWTGSPSQVQSSEGKYRAWGDIWREHALLARLWPGRSGCIVQSGVLLGWGEKEKVLLCITWHQRAIGVRGGGFGSSVFADGLRCEPLNGLQSHFVKDYPLWRDVLGQNLEIDVFALDGIQGGVGVLSVLDPGLDCQRGVHL